MSERTALFASVTAALFLLLIAVWLDCRLLFQAPVAVGIDGYYYVLQINTLRNEGRLYFPTDAPFVIYLLAALRFFVSDTVLAVKLGALSLNVLLNLGVLAFVSTVTRKVWFGLCGLAITAFSGLHLYFISEFLNNLGALTFLVWGAWAILKFVQTGKKKWLVFSILLLFCAIFSHRSTIGLIVLNIVTFLLAYILINPGFGSRFKIPAIAFIAFLFISPLILSWQLFFSLPEILAGELLKYPGNLYRPLNLAETLMLTVALPGVFFLWLRRRSVLQDNFAGVVLVSVALWSFLLTLNPFLSHAGVVSITGRLGALAHLQAAIIVSILLWLLYNVSRRLCFGTAFIFLPLLVLSYSAFFAPIPMSLRKEYLQAREKLARELPSLLSTHCEKPIIVARHGEQFLVTAITGVSSQQKPPQEKHHQCTFWLLQLPSDNSVYLSEGLLISQNKFILLDDSELKIYLSGFPKDELRRFVLVNPHLKDSGLDFR